MSAFQRVLPPTLREMESIVHGRRWWMSAGRHPLSNVSMDGWRGGKLYVPPNDYDEFLTRIAQELDRGIPLYLIERRTDPIFKWHADLDLIAEKELDVDQLLSIVQILQRCLHETVGHKSSLLVLRNEPTRKRGTSMIKTGVHVIALKAGVTTEQCLLIRERALPDLRVLLELSVPWEDAYDTSVYVGNGLRMIGCRKMEPCDACKSGEAIRLTTCGHCAGTKRIDAGRPYVMSDFIDTSGHADQKKLRALQANTALALKLTSIRCFDRYFPPSAVVVQKRTPNKRRASPQMDTTIAAPDLSTALERILVSALDASFSGLRVGEPKPCAGGVVLKVLSPRFCANVHREHSSSTPFLFVSKEGFVSQRCHCPKYDCRGFRSHAMPVGWDELRRCGLLQPDSGLPLAFSFAGVKAARV